MMQGHGGESTRAEGPTGCAEAPPRRMVPSAMWAIEVRIDKVGRPRGFCGPEVPRTR
jgi:hypothetical protein